MSDPIVTPTSRYAPTLGNIQRILLAQGVTDEQFEEVVEEVSKIGSRTLMSPGSIIDNGDALALSEAADLMLIGYLVHEFSVAMPNPFHE